MQIRLADPADVKEITNIYNYAVTKTDATLDTEEKTAEDMSGWLSKHQGRYPAVVLEIEDGSIGGYASLSKFSERGAYYPSAEISIYISPDHHSQGFGLTLCRRLNELAIKYEFDALIAIFTAGNIRTERMLERCGYEKTGEMRRVGKKFGKSLDLLIYQYFTNSANR